MSTQRSRGFVQTISIAFPHLTNKEAKWAIRIGFMGKCKALSFFVWCQRCYLLQSSIDVFLSCWRCFLLQSYVDFFCLIEWIRALLNSWPFSLFVITCAFVLLFHLFFFLLALFSCFINSFLVHYVVGIEFLKSWLWKFTFG